MTYYFEEEYVNFESLVGVTIESIELNGSNTEITLVGNDGYTYRMYHDQDCCEDVYVESVVGDLNDLVGSPILTAEESTNSEGEPLNEYDESFTWTFYKLSTLKGYVDIRWYGTSNGYYSEVVSLVRVRTHAVD